MRIGQTAIIVVMTLFAISAACGGSNGIRPSGGDEDEGQPRALTVAEALKADERQMRVKGAVLAREEDVRLCDALAQSFPPQCGAPSLRLVGFDMTSAEGMQEAGTVRWAENISVVGTRSGDTLTIDPRRR